MIKINKKTYSLQAIKRAMYMLLPDCVIELQETDKEWLIDDHKKNIIKEDFLKCLLEMQLQIDLEKEFYEIRNMLVAQALEPYSDVDDLLKRIM